jgi:glycosyltransferase involved in cell wall biosynthesis
MNRYINPFRRAWAWKVSFENRLRELELQREAHEHRVVAVHEQVSALEGRISVLEADVSVLRQRATLTLSLDSERFLHLAKPAARDINFEENVKICITKRRDSLVMLWMRREDAELTGIAGVPPSTLIEDICTGEITKLYLISKAANGWRVESIPLLLEAMRKEPVGALFWLQAHCSSSVEPSEASYFQCLDFIIENIDLIDFHALGYAGQGGGAPWPFDAVEKLPFFVPASPSQKSALFLHNNYYHFNCLADGLKARGWDVMTVSLESPDSRQQQFYHGEDINIFDADPEVMAEKARQLLKTLPERFGSLHFHGMGLPSLFPGYWENREDPLLIPWDLLELRRHRMVIGYMPSGCLDGGKQTSINELTGGLCERCVWQLRPDVCSDARSLAWNLKLQRFCDWVGLECDHATPERIGKKTVYGPVVTTLDPTRWHPDITPPDEMRIDRNHEEIIIYHAVGNYTERAKEGRDIKGTGAVLSAVEKLQGEGLPVRLVFATDVPSTKVRFLQVQADIVVDQLNYGRYGANAREAMMLGKPTICRLTPKQAHPLEPLRPIVESPLVDASETSLVDVLRWLARDKEARAAIARRSREFAVAWHGKEACAERYERIIDRIRSGLPPETPDLYPPAA